MGDFLASVCGGSWGSLSQEQAIFPMLLKAGFPLGRSPSKRKAFPSNNLCFSFSFYLFDSSMSMHSSLNILVTYIPGVG